jgi:hypothetical protein
MAKASSPVSSKSDGLGLETTVYGFNEFKKELKAFDPALRKAMDKEIRDTMTGIVAKARGMVPEQPLSGWRVGGAGDRYGGKARLPYWNASLAKRGIVVRQGGKRSRGSATTAAWRIANQSAGGAVFEYASSGPSESAFVKAIQNVGGRPSRLIWRAWDQAGGEDRIAKEILGIVKVYETILEQNIKNT